MWGTGPDDEAIIQIFLDELARKIRDTTELFAARRPGNPEIEITLTAGQASKSIGIYCMGTKVLGFCDGHAYNVGSLADSTIEARAIAFALVAAYEDLDGSDFTLSHSLPW